jgi:hypothetical protein
MYTRCNLVSLTLTVSTLLAISGLVLLLAMSFHGLMQIKDFLMGVGSGLCLVILFLAGSEIYTVRKRRKLLSRLLGFSAAILAVGLVCCFTLQHPGYRSKAPAAYFEQLAGVLWALSSAAVYPSLREYRRLKTLVKLACSPLCNHPGSPFGQDFLRRK